MLQRKDFTPYDQSCYKVVYYCNLAIQEARPDSKCYHEVLGFYILNSSTTKVSAVRDAQQSARRKPLQLRYCPSLVPKCQKHLTKHAWILPISVSQNPSLPCKFTDKLWALSTTQHSKIISDHLNITRKAWETFIMNENSEKIQRALRHKMHTSNDNIFVSGDSVCYKRASNRRWRGPAKVLRKDGQQVLVKWGGLCLLPFLSSFIRTAKSTSALTASSDNFEKDNDTNTLGVIQPPRQKLTAATPNETSSDSKNEHTDNEIFKQKYHSNSQFPQRKHLTQTKNQRKI